MTRKEMAGFRQRLTAMLHRVDYERNLLKQEALQPTGGEASGGLSNVPTHPSDLGSRSFEEEVTLGLLQNEEQIIDDINQALQRIETGTFGKCETCGKPIPMQRLQAVPYARRCVPCAESAPSD